MISTMSLESASGNVLHALGTPPIPEIIIGAFAVAVVIWGVRKAYENALG